MTTARPHNAQRTGPRPADGPDLRLSVWPTAQRDASTQRRGRYLPASTAPPAQMMPLIDAVLLARGGLAIEHEDRWASLAAATLAHARRQGATGTAEVIRGDARLLPGLLPPGTAGQGALVA